MTTIHWWQGWLACGTSNLRRLRARGISKPGLWYLRTIPSQPTGDTPVKRALFNGCTQKIRDGLQ